MAFADDDPDEIVSRSALAFGPLSRGCGLWLLSVCAWLFAMPLTRRQLLAYAGAAGIASLTGCGTHEAAAPPHAHRVIITTDFAVPHVDPDDYYDVVCGVALGVDGFVLDAPNAYSVAALSEIGAPVLEPTAIRRADAVVVTGAATHAARYHRADQRVILFAGDADGIPEYNQQGDPAAYDFLKPRSRWVPCFAGGLWRTDRRASYVQTTDAALLDGQPVVCWFNDYISDAYGLRNLWVGPLIRFAWQDTWRGHSIATGAFRAGPNLPVDMVSGARELLARVRATCQAA
jgi:hypothetical protein